MELNLNLIAGVVVFEKNEAQEGYKPVGSQEVKVVSDGESVSFTTEEGQRWWCDQSAIAAVVGSSGADMALGVNLWTGTGTTRRREPGPPR